MRHTVSITRYIDLFSNIVVLARFAICLNDILLIFTRLSATEATIYSNVMLWLVKPGSVGTVGTIGRSLVALLLLILEIFSAQICLCFYYVISSRKYFGKL